MPGTGPGGAGLSTDMRVRSKRDARRQVIFAGPDYDVRMSFRYRVVASLVLLLATLSASSLCAQRLPANVVPSHYTLEISPDIAAKTFTGRESIRVALAQSAATITLNSAEIKIDSVQAVAGGATETGTVTYQPAEEEATLTFPEPLPAGPVELRLAYTGVLNNDLRGFYLSHTAKRDYAVTQFEATDARRAFPSFDEPALKATFDLSLTIDKRDTVIANTTMLRDVPAADGRHTETFAETPRMSTYLLAFQVGDWACIRGAADGTPIRVCATPDKVELTHYALTAAEHFLHYYDQYFGVKYALPKLDLIGIPDFSAGAMENWGCITYRETLLLVGSNDTLTAHREVASVIAHEMAHQWFGDLVTAQWWNNIWLNEGFATWMASKAVGEWQPTWTEPEATAVELNETLNLDAAHVTRTIRSPADTPTQIGQQFDGLSYGKAGAVLGMVEHFVSPAVFERGVHSYLEAHKFANATAEDFWGAETAASHQPVDRIMASFITQPGVPLLHFGDASGGQLAVTQSRFFLDPQGAPSSAQTWTLPVCARGGGCQIVSGASASLSHTQPDTLLNAGGVGYFRSEYTPATVHALTAKTTTFTGPERIVFLGDREASMRTGQSPVGDYLALVAALRDDPSGYVLQQIFKGTDAIRSIADDAQRGDVDRWIVRTFGPAYAALPVAAANEAPDVTVRRAALFEQLGLRGDPAVVAAAQAIANRFLDGDPGAGALGPRALRIAAANADPAFYDRLLAASETESAPNTHVAELEALGYVTDPTLIGRTVDRMISGEVRKQESWIPLRRLLEHTASQQVAWDDLRAHWDIFARQFSGGIEGSLGGRVITGTGNFCSAEKETEVREFFTAHSFEGSSRPLGEALAKIHACTELRGEQQTNLASWVSSTK